MLNMIQIWQKLFLPYKPAGGYLDLVRAYVEYDTIRAIMAKTILAIQACRRIFGSVAFVRGYLDMKMETKFVLILKT